MANQTDGRVGGEADELVNAPLRSYRYDSRNPEHHAVAAEILRVALEESVRAGDDFRASLFYLVGRIADGTDHETGCDRALEQIKANGARA